MRALVATGDRSRTAARTHPALVIGGLAALVALPLLVAAVALHGRDWVPTLDLAMTELRVRDVASTHPPLIGLPGRIGTLLEQGSHPGPASFWALWPFYQVFGASSWGLQAAACTLQVLAIAAFLWIIYRRGGTGLAVGGAAVLALLVRAYGIGTLAEPWNLFLPLLWWMVFLVAAWSVLCDDLPLLPVAAVAGSFCMQTHVSYVGLVAGLGAVAAAGVALNARSRRNDPANRRAALRWSLIAAGVLVVLWAPPVIDEVAHSPGNLSILRDYFGDPPEAPVGVRRGVELLLARLDPWSLVAEDQVAAGTLADQSDATGGSVVPGLLLLGTWLAAVVAAWRMRHRALARLHLVSGAALALGAATASRIFGFVWYYLILWALGITALLLLATGWTAAEVARRGLHDDGRRRTGSRLGATALLGSAVLSTVVLLPGAAGVDEPAPRLSETLGTLLPPTVDALAGGAGPATGRDGRYLVTWADALSIGSSGFGLLGELERAGFDVGVTNSYRAPATPYRVRDREDATAIVHVATGENIERARAEPGYIEVAFVEPRTRAEQREYAELRAQVIEELHGAGRGDVVPLVDANVFAAALDTRVPRHARELVSRMVDLGLPAAVFLGRAGAGARPIRILAP